MCIAGGSSSGRSRSGGHRPTSSAGVAVSRTSLPGQLPTAGDVAGVIRVRYGLRGNEVAGPTGPYNVLCITAAGLPSPLFPTPLGSF